MYRISTPLSNKCVAKVWRRLWILAGFLMFALQNAFLNMFWADRTVHGSRFIIRSFRRSCGGFF
jgi:hypothetical protein